MLGLVQLFAEESEGERQIVMMRMMMFLLMVTGKRMRMKMRIILMIMTGMIIVLFAEKRGEEMATKSRIKNVPGTGGMPAAFGGAGGRHLSQQFSVSPCLQGVPKKLTNRKKILTIIECCGAKISH